ncbi:helix-turn-helix domain-containing protein [Streptomyces sp. NPDC088736]|uniref:helix-turn-helix domain-containing protein n=1 Tax=Streptomyces sp. NPDC088736 TaxID=3365881 RepID=UPI0038054607
MATRDLGRLATRVKAHRHEQYPSRDAAATAAGVTRNTWKRVEEGQEVRELTYAKVDKALGWVTGSCILIAEGGEPFLAAGFPAYSPAATPELPSEDEARRAAYEAARGAMPKTPIGEVDDFVDRFVKALRQTGQVGDSG